MGTETMGRKHPFKSFFIKTIIQDILRDADEPIYANDILHIIQTQEDLPWKQWRKNLGKNELMRYLIILRKEGKIKYFRHQTKWWNVGDWDKWET